MTLFKISLFLTGFFSLFAIPSYNGVLLVHIFLVISLFLSFCLLFTKENIFLLKAEYSLLLIGILYYASVMFGTINSGAYEGLLTSQLFFMSFLLVFIMHKIGDNYKLINIFLKGFVYSGIATSLYCIIDFIYFYSGNFNTLNNVIWPQMLLSKSNEHTFLNQINLFGIILFRPSGFSWDPGLSITGLIIAFVFVSESIVKLKLRKLVLLLFSIAIIISTSRTSVISLLFYLFIVKKVQNLYIRFGYDKVSVLNYLAVFILFFFLYIGLFIPYDGSISNLGTARHLKYFSSTFYFYRQNIFEFLFGYGYTGVGQYFNEYVPWLKNTGDFYFDNNLNPESTLTNVFFYGGSIGSLFWVITYLQSFLKGAKEVKTILLILLLLSNGYAINSVWFNMIYNILIIYGITKWRQNEIIH